MTDDMTPAEKTAAEEWCEESGHSWEHLYSVYGCTRCGEECTDD